VTAGTLGQDLVPVLQIVQITLGMVAVIIMFYVATIAVLTRIPSLPFFEHEPKLRVIVWHTGVVDIAVLT